MIASKTMRAAVLLRPGAIELQDVPIPAPPPGGLVVRVRAALTDGTDFKAFRRGHPRMPMPTPFGHEFSGDVASSDNPGFAAGEAVMCVHTAPCGECYWCKHGQEELCETIMPTMILGAYAEYIAIPERIVKRNCYVKPPGLSYAAAAFLEPLSCVVHSLDLLPTRPGDTVLVIGDGGFGLLHAMLLQQAGASMLLAGRREARLKIARDLGVETINARSQNIGGEIRKRTDGRGADVVIECTGREEVWEAAPDLSRRGGTVSFFGGLPADAKALFTASRLHYDEIRLISPFHFTPSAVKRARDILVEKRIDPLPLVTETVPLSEIATVFERLKNGEGIKFAVKP
ncbi:MAG TPA: zinc-binding dehydrogenase [Candidatus Rubrimentiphilum sp.]|nr:zinc-binding dehydrogenase [Candidatus Rubrimentiphilum sp.]